MKIYDNSKYYVGEEKNVNLINSDEYLKLIFKKPIINKDFKEGILKIIDIININEKKLILETENNLIVEIDLKREKKILNFLNINSIEKFIEWIKENKKEFINKINYVYLTNENKGSIIEYLKILYHNEFKNELKNSNKIYYCKLISRNSGGFFCEIDNLITVFMPGSLAAANKIEDYELFFKENNNKLIPVMIDNYIKENNIFIVSYKKYLNKILPEKIKEIVIGDLMKGKITGFSKFGIFIEFDNLYTGLLHITNMNEKMKNEFLTKQYKIGDNIISRIISITNNYNLILSTIDL